MFLWEFRVLNNVNLSAFNVNRSLYTTIYNSACERAAHLHYFASKILTLMQEIKSECSFRSKSYSDLASYWADEGLVVRNNSGCFTLKTFYQSELLTGVNSIKCVMFTIAWQCHICCNIIIYKNVSSKIVSRCIWWRKSILL